MSWYRDELEDEMHRLPPWLLRNASRRKVLYPKIIGVIALIVGAVGYKMHPWLGFIAVLAAWPIFEIIIYQEACAEQGIHAATNIFSIPNIQDVLAS